MTNDSNDTGRPAHDLQAKVAALKAVIDTARALVADWKAPRVTDGRALTAAVEALDEDVAANTSPWLAWALGEVAAEFGRMREAAGYERGKAEALDGWASLPENVRVLITDAAIELQRCAENDIDTERFLAVWSQHLAAVREGRFGRYALKTDGSGVDESPHPDLTKVTVNFVPRSVAALDEAAALTADTKTEVINRAVQMWAFLARQTAHGEALLLRGVDGTMRLVKLDSDGGEQL